MKKNIKIWRSLFVLLFLINGQLVFASEIIVIKKFDSTVLNQRLAEELFVRIKTIINRQKDFDYATPEDIKTIINNNYPQEKVDDCSSLSCLIKFKERLQLRYLIDGEITDLEKLYSTRFNLFDIQEERSYSFMTPYTAASDNNMYILTALVRILNLPIEKQIKVDPLAEKQAELALLEKEFVVKREISRRLGVEKNNLQQTLDTLTERYIKFKDLVKELKITNEEEKRQKD